MNVGDPIDLAQYEDKNEALDILRDAIATLVFENFEEYASRYDRGALGSDPHLGYMEQRRLEYLKNKWHRDVWEEELSFYLTPAEREQQSVAESMDKIIISKHNAAIMAPILARREEEMKYNFLAYMKANWDNS